MRTSVSVLVALTLAPLLAAAGPLPSGETHKPPVFVEPTSDYIRLVSHGDNYDIYSSYIALGIGSEKDRMRVEAVQGGKVIGKSDCGARFHESPTSWFGGDCKIENLKAKGAIELRLIYADDATDKEYIARTYPITVRAWKGNGDKFAYLPDDVLAIAYVHHGGDDDGDGRGKPIIDIWTTGQYLVNKSATFRCTVDGKKIPDIDATMTSPSFARENDEISTRRIDGKIDVSFHYVRFAIIPHVMIGPKRELSFPFLVDNPGKWECNFRIEGKVFRIFSFTVNKEGMIEPSELQTKATKPFRMFPGQMIMDMRIPKDAPYEIRLRNDAMKKSVGFGLPWPESPKAKEAQAALPPTMGLPD